MVGHEGDSSWPESRFKEVARRLRIELEEMQSFLLITPAKSQAFLSSPMRKQLGEQIGAAIRFHLRRFFNAVPLTPTNTDSTRFPQPAIDYSNCRSRVYQLVRMVGDGDERDNPIADGAISSVFNFAIRQIYSFFDPVTNSIATGSDLIVGGEVGYNGNEENIGCNFLPSVPAGYGMEPVLSAIKCCHDVLASGKACKFVVDLLDWPGVQDAVNAVGGWRPIEELASILTLHNLENVCPEVAHFQILKDVNVLIGTIRSSMTHIEETMASAEEALSRTWRRFNCGKAALLHSSWCSVSALQRIVRFIHCLI